MYLCRHEAHFRPSAYLHTYSSLCYRHDILTLFLVYKYKECIIQPMAFIPKLGCVYFFSRVCIYLFMFPTPSFNFLTHVQTGEFNHSKSLQSCLWLCETLHEHKTTKILFLHADSSLWSTVCSLCTTCEMELCILYSYIYIPVGTS